MSKIKIQKLDSNYMFIDSECLTDELESLLNRLFKVTEIMYLDKALLDEEANEDREIEILETDDKNNNGSDKIKNYYKIKAKVTYSLWKLETNDNGTSYVKIPMGCYKYLISHLILNGYELDIADDVLNDNNFERLQLTDKWKTILDSDFRVVDGHNQYYYLNELISKSRGLGQLYTGYGKSELLLAIVESFLETYNEGNVVVLVPTSKIRDEFIQRSQKWDVCIQPEYQEFNSRFQLINPMGFFRSNALKDDDKKLKEYFHNTKLVIIDEVHHLSSNSYRNLLDNYLNNYDYLYGVSGTVDSLNGTIPSPAKELSSYPYNLGVIIGYLGYPRVIVKNPTSLFIGLLTYEGKKVPNFLIDKYQPSMRILFNDPQIPTKLIDFLLNNPIRRVFVPVVEIKSGNKIIERINSVLGEKSGIMVSSKGTYPDVTEWGYADLKDYLNNCSDFRVIAGTSSIYEGFDSDKINTVFLAIGKSQRMVIQPTGRGTRSTVTPMVILPWDNNYKNPIVNSQTKKRRAKLDIEFKNSIFVDEIDQVKDL